MQSPHHPDTTNQAGADLTFCNPQHIYAIYAIYSIYTPRVRLDNTTAHRQLFTSFVRGLGMCEAHPLLRWGGGVVVWWGIQRIQCGYTASCSQHFVMLLDNWHSWAAGAGCRGYCGQVRGSCSWWQVVLMGQQSDTTSEKLLLVVNIPESSGSIFHHRSIRGKYSLGRGAGLPNK